jgi:hypothetical protein
MNGTNSTSADERRELYVKRNMMLFFQLSVVD